MCDSFRRLTIKERFAKVRHILKSILIGATIYDLAQGPLRMRWYIEQALMLAVIGDMLGLPVGSYYRLKLIPYWFPRIASWETALLREKDVVDMMTS